MTFFTRSPSIRIARAFIGKVKSQRFRQVSMQLQIPLLPTQRCLSQSMRSWLDQCKAWSQEPSGTKQDRFVHSLGPFLDGSRHANFSLKTEPSTVEAAAHAVAAIRSFSLDNVGAKIGQQRTRERARRDLAEFQHTHAA